MKTIVDTCVWSLSLRRRDQSLLNPEELQMLVELRKVVQSTQAAILGPIRQEVLSGIRDKTQFVKTQSLLDPFPDEEIVTDDYVEAARLFNLCQGRGVQCGPVDILICAVAIRNSYGVMTNDQGLRRCMSVLRAEGLSL
jgi:predicted nucleic acid-binding protein